MTTPKDTPISKPAPTHDKGTEDKMTGTNIERELGRMDAEIRQTRKQQDQDRAHFNNELARINVTLTSQDGKLDSLLESQKIAAAVRERLAGDADKRYKKTARWSGFISGVVIVFIGALTKWILFKYLGVGIWI